MPSVSNSSQIAAQVYASQVARQRSEPQVRPQAAPVEKAAKPETKSERSAPKDRIDVKHTERLDQKRSSEAAAKQARADETRDQFAREAPRAAEHSRILKPGSTLDIRV